MTEDRPACRRRAMDLLARREHSRLELRNKLESREFEPALVAEVLDELEHDGLLSAERFTRSFINSRYSRGQGPRRISRELAERGIDDVGQWLSDDCYDWCELARATRIKRFGSEPPADAKEKARQIRFLEYRGFGYDQIRQALSGNDD